MAPGCGLLKSFSKIRSHLFEEPKMHYNIILFGVNKVCSILEDTAHMAYHILPFIDFLHKLYEIIIHKLYVFHNQILTNC